MLTIVIKLLKALHSESSPWQVAIPFALALIVGLTPLFSVHNALILFFVCILRVNFGAFAFGVFVFSGLAWFIDPLSIRLGEHLLAVPTLTPLYTALYQSEFWRVTGYNNTLTLGGLGASLLAFVPLLLSSWWLIVQYRGRFMAWLNKLKITQMLKASKLYTAYLKFGG